jgi:tetratricopeptide (TPR) repeat protein/transcriptional regulator with XRE-family HTH domain
VPTFGELLSQYIERAGITDAELARSTGVQRQTIFRWKEGLTARPRYREDVIRIAAKLRLSPAERDALLLAAGFPPNEPVSQPMPSRDVQGLEETLNTKEPADDQNGATLPTPTVPPASHPSRLIERPGAMLTTAAGLILIVAVVGAFALRTFDPAMVATATAPPTLAATIAPTTTPQPTGAPPTTPSVIAQPGEQLIAIAPFIGYTSSDLRFNIAGRIREALEEEISSADLPDMRIAILPEPIGEPEQAEAVLASSGAVLVIWGEYDAGRVRAGLSTPAMEDAYWITPVDAPSSLPFVINQDVPRDARIFALYTLGSYYRTIGDNSKALAIYRRALAQNPSDPAIAASIHFYIGLLTPLVSGYTTESFSESIYHYTKTLDLQPTWDNARYNRGTSHLGRALLSLNERADLDAAITDLTLVIQRRPNRIDPLLNRGIAYYQRNDADDLDAAHADFTRAIELEPADHRAYYHRALVTIRNGDDDAWQVDLAQAAALAPDYAPIQNAFCWGYGMAGESEIALPYCDAAVAADPTGASFDSRAITLAQLGRYTDAISDLNDYLAWVLDSYPGLYDKYRGPSVELWIETLERGENPFTPEALDVLRRGVE